MSGGGPSDGLVYGLIIAIGVIELTLVGMTGYFAWRAYTNSSLWQASGAIVSLAAALYLPWRLRS
jgi:hypothetical protein